MGDCTVGATRAVDDVVNKVSTAEDAMAGGENVVDPLVKIPGHVIHTFGGHTLGERSRDRKGVGQLIAPRIVEFGKVVGRVGAKQALDGRLLPGVACAFPKRVSIRICCRTSRRPGVVM